MTLVCWRIASDTPDYLAEDMTGAGAKISGGRWNRPGTPLVYTAESIALACLETVVHSAAGSLPLNRYLIRIDIPASIWKRAVHFDADANVGWNALPFGKVSLDAGNAWLASSASALLLVPSVVIPEEHNILINPAHKDAKRLKVSKLRLFSYDPHLLAISYGLPAPSKR